MPTLTKERRQVLMLRLVLGLMAAVFAYIYWDDIVPPPAGGELPAPPLTRVEIPAAADKSLYDRADFKALRRFGDIPVKPLRSGGSAEPFITELR